MGFLKTRVAFSLKKKKNVLSKIKDETTANQHLITKNAAEQRQGAVPQQQLVSERRQPQLERALSENVVDDYDRIYLQRTDTDMFPGTEHVPNGQFSADTTTYGERSNAILDHIQPEPREKRPQLPPLFPEEASNDDKEGPLTESEKLLAKLPADLWFLISTYLDPLSAANLAHSCKTLRYRLGARPWRALDISENLKHKTAFLSPMDKHLPNHLFCFLCAVYHSRLRMGKEKLQANHVANPVFDCPNAQKLFLPRTRLTHGRELPYAYVQLATRGPRHSSHHGIPLSSLTKRWKCRDSGWTHDTVFHLAENGHLWMRVRSTTFAKANLQPNELRLLLYSRSDYAPYFSVCAHWSNGNLMHLCKCALSHVPKPAVGVIDQWRKGPKLDFKAMKTNMFPRQCDECKMLRRCSECPTEYLIRIKLIEDPKDRVSPFKHALTITRWSDLGDGSSPTQSPEWASCDGQVWYDSIKVVKNASLCSLFESAVSGIAPGDRVVPLETFNYGGNNDVY